MKNSILVLRKTKVFFISLIFFFFSCTTEASAPTSEFNDIPFALKNIIKGVNWVGEPREMPDYAIPTAKDFGIEWISQTPFGWMQNQNSPSVRFSSQSGWWGETDKGITITSKEAHNREIKVMLKPHLWISNPINGGWRADIDFDSDVLWEQWESDYTEFITHYAKLAEKENIEMLCLGTELTNSSISRPKYWENLIVDIRKIYSGKLIYAANWYREFEMTNIWTHLDYIGIQAYFPLTDKESPTIEELISGWQPHIEKIEAVAQKFDKKVIFTEIGYTNSKGTAIHPWEWSENISLSRLDHSEQINAYEALFHALGRKNWFGGTFIWKWYPSGRRVSGNRIEFSPQNKPAENILKKWYTFQ